MAEETSTPDISVVIPCYNAERWVGRAIDSVLAQEGVTVEAIVIDDGSTDGSVEVLRRYEDRIHWESGPNRGACVARNRGLALTRADYVMFLDADDFVSEDLLVSMRERIISQYADCAVAQVFDHSERTSPTPRRIPRTDNWRYFLEDWLSGAFVPPCGLLWRRSFVDHLGGWNPRLTKNQDGELVYRSVLEDAIFCTALHGHAVYWHHSGSRISSNLTEARLFDSFATLQSLVDLLYARGQLHGELRRTISLSSHSLERRATELSDPCVARRIASFRRSYGFPRYDGSTLHIVTSRIIGLKRKQDISRSFQKLRKRLPAWRRFKKYKA